MEGGVNEIFEEEKNTKKKTTKKITTRTTSDGSAQTQEKIEETVTEEIVTVIKRPISSQRLQSELISEKSPRSEVQDPRTNLVYHQNNKDTTPGLPKLDVHHLMNPGENLDNSLSSSQSKQKLKRIKEEDEEG